MTPEEGISAEVSKRLISFWKLHRRFDANIRDLARYASVSPDTVYRWLNGTSLPKPAKAQLIDSWLNARKA